MYYQQSNDMKLKSILIHSFGITFLVPVLIYLADDKSYFSKQQMKRSLYFNLLFALSWISLLFVESVIGFISGGFFLPVATFINGFVFFGYFLYIAYISFNIWNNRYIDYPFVDNFIRNKSMK